MLAWLTVVARHEAYRLAPRLQARDAGEQRRDHRRGGADHASSIPTVAPARTATRWRGIELRQCSRRSPALKPAQRTTLALKAAGFKYKEIQELCGGKTYTWVNRHITEGRAALRAARESATMEATP